MRLNLGPCGDNQVRCAVCNEPMHWRALRPDGAGYPYCPREMEHDRMNPINVTGYDRDERTALAVEQFTKRPGGQRNMKIHLVTIAATAESEPDKTFLVKAHTKAGAEKFVRGKFKPSVEARIPTQDELVAALKAGIEIEDATASPQAATTEPSQQENQ